MRSAPAIGVEYRPSGALAACIAVLIALAVLAVALSGLALWQVTILAISALCYGAGSLWRHRRPRVRALVWRSDGGVSITLTDRAGNAREVLGDLRDARVFGPLIVLHLRWPPRGRASLWLLPDNLDAGTRRRLRVRLNVDGARPASVNADNI